MSNYSEGQGCTCFAYSESECACGADWTPEEVYKLRAENTALREALEKIQVLSDKAQDELTQARPVCISNNLHELRVLVTKALARKDKT